MCLTDHKESLCNHANLPVSIAQLLEDCNKEVGQIRQAAKLPLKLQLIFKSNHKLLFKYLFILSYKYNLSKSLSSVRKKLEKFKTVSGKLLKKVCSALLTRKLIDKSWTLKPSVDTLVNLANLGPMMSILVNGFQTTCVLDTGSAFTLVPFQIWDKL